MCAAKRATTAEGVEKAAARQAKEAAKSSKHKRKVAEARASSAAKSRASTGAGQDGADDDDYSDAPPAGKKRRTVGEAGDASADGKAAKKAAAAAKKGSKIAAAAMRAEDALRIGKPSGSKTSGSKTSGGKTSGKSSGNAEAADGAAADGAAEHALLAVVKGEEGEGKVPAGAGGGLRATDDCEPGAELPEGAKAWDIEVVEVGDPAEFAPTVLDIIPGLECVLPPQRLCCAVCLPPVLAISNAMCSQQSSVGRRAGPVGFVFVSTALKTEPQHATAVRRILSLPFSLQRRRQDGGVPYLANQTPGHIILRYKIDAMEKTPQLPFSTCSMKQYPGQQAPAASYVRASLSCAFASDQTWLIQRWAIGNWLIDRWSVAATLPLRQRWFGS